MTGRVQVRACGEHCGCTAGFSGRNSERVFDFRDSRRCPCGVLRLIPLGPGTHASAEDHLAFIGHYEVGRALSESAEWPTWKPGAEFKAARETSAAARRR